tara:strand:+ start:968 stop:1390 length:423 start_codon:yes stop_codon:yes gene_type:complete
MQNSNLYRSEDFRLVVSGKTIARSTDCSIDISVEAIEVSAFESGRYKEFVPGDITGTFSGTQTVVNTGYTSTTGTSFYQLLQSVIATSEPVSFVFKDIANTSNKLSGECVVTSLSLSSSKGAVHTYSISGNLSGPITILA